MVSILGKESIIVDYAIWGEVVVRDLFTHVASSTYVLITDTNLQYASSNVRLNISDLRVLVVLVRFCVLSIRVNDTNSEALKRSLCSILQESLSGCKREHESGLSSANISNS